MKALVMQKHGDLSELEVTDVPAPEVSGPRDVVVSVRTAALNHLDLCTLGGLTGLFLEFPHVLGGDGAGVVAAVGEEVRRVRVGDRVLINPGLSCYECEHCGAGEHSLCNRFRLLGEHTWGTLGEQVVVPDRNLERIPVPPAPHPEISWAEAAAFPLVTLTAWRMLVTAAAVRPGETVLIWGVGGGVSLAALAVARLMGARVIATSSSDEKLDIAREHGADVVINHGQKKVVREVWKHTGKRGADVVIDNVGEATWERSLQVLSKGGRLVTCGATTGPKLMTDARALFWNQYRIIGSTMGNASEFREIVRQLGRGALRPRVDSVLPLDRAVDGLRRLQAGEQMGKVVVEITNDE